MSDPLVSIIMPVYRVEKYLETSVKSVLNQSYSSFELLLVDDCSPDGCPDLCDKLAQTDNRIRVIHLDKNQGQGVARNVGIDNAKGKYILFLDSDDTFDNNLLKTVISSALSNNAQVVIFGLVEEHEDKNGEIFKTRSVTYEQKQLVTATDVRNEVVKLEQSELYGYAANKLFDLSYLRSCNARFSTMAFNEDIIFSIDVFMNLERCNIISATLYHYAKRVNSSTTSRFIPTYYKDIMLKIDRLYEQLKTWNMLTTEALEMISSRYLRYFFSSIERNFDKRSNMTSKQRKQFFFDEISTQRYKNLRPYLNGGGLSGLMAKAFYKQNYCFCNLIAKTISFVKKYLPQLFSKLS